MLSLAITLMPLLLGVAAWILSAANLFSRQPHRWIPSVSWFSCASALWFPLCSWNLWAQNEDVSALLDCGHAYALCASILLLGNLFLTGLAHLRFKKQ